MGEGREFGNVYQLDRGDFLSGRSQSPLHSLKGQDPMNIYQFWKDILEQNAAAIKAYFAPAAYINWHCTNEHFTVDEFIIANCEYPGRWEGEVERVEKINDLFMTVTRVYPKDGSMSFHATSFIRVVDDKITAVDEYWADDGTAPEWRLEKGIGREIISGKKR